MRSAATLGILAVILIGIVALTLRPYHGNLTTLFHYDTVMQADHPVPADFVILDVPGYDGMQYYYIARSIPHLLTPSGRGEIGIASEQLRSYSYQRILLPAAAWALSLGAIDLLPIAFIVINVLSLLLTAWTILRWKPAAWLYTLALTLSPAALIALHFNLAEPLTILLLTIFLMRFQERSPLSIHGYMDTWGVILLSLLVLSREVNILFIGLLIIWSLFHRRWKDIALLMIPLAVFVLWHGIIYRIFGVIPFLISTDKGALPFSAIIDILRGTQGYNKLTLSSIAYFFLFVLPALAWILTRVLRRGKISFLEFAIFSFLFLMTTMAWHIWGSITSIGRVITPVYPLTMVYAAQHDTPMARFLALSVLGLGLAIGLALTLTIHPYHLA